MNYCFSNSLQEHERDKDSSAGLFFPWDIKDLTLSCYTTLVNLAIPRKPDTKTAVMAPADRGKSERP